MSAATALIRAKSAAWLRPIELTDGQISGVGTAMTFDFVQNNKLAMTVPAGSAAAETGTIDIVAGNGITVKYTKEERAIDKDGNLVASTSTGGGTGAGDSAGFTLLGVEKADMLVFHEYAGNPWLLCVAAGENATAAEDFYVYLLGTMGGIDLTVAPEAVSSIDITITGGKAYSLDGVVLASALAWAPAAITPVGPAGMDAITPEPLLEADVTAGTYTGSGAASGLLSGRMVIK